MGTAPRSSGALGDGVESRAVWLIAALVVSLDSRFRHACAGLPLPGKSPRYGLGLWNSIPWTFAIEGLLWVACLALYVRARRPRNWVGALALWSFVLISTVMWASGPWSAPAPNERALAWFALIGWIIVPWAVWADRGHVARGPG